MLATIAVAGPAKGLAAVKLEGPPDERLYAFEAVGLLLGLEEVPEGKMKDYLALLLVPLCVQVLLFCLPGGFANVCSTIAILEIYKIL